MVFTKTINHTVAAATTELADRAEPLLEQIRHDANEESRRFRNQVANSLELGTWVIAGAILAGFLVHGFLSRAGE